MFRKRANKFRADWKMILLFFFTAGFPVHGGGVGHESRSPDASELETTLNSIGFGGTHSTASVSSCKIKIKRIFGADSQCDYDNSLREEIYVLPMREIEAVQFLGNDRLGEWNLLTFNDSLSNSIEGIEKMMDEERSSGASQLSMSERITLKLNGRDHDYRWWWRSCDGSLRFQIRDTKVLAITSNRPFVDNEKRLLYRYWSQCNEEK